MRIYISYLIFLTLYVEIIKAMKIKFILPLLALTAFLFSCIEHEVVPPPSPNLDLSGTFKGEIDGTTVEYVENINGMFVNPDIERQILPAPDPSTAVYTVDMRSAEQLDIIKISIGSVEFQSSVAQRPSINQFEDFFMNNMTPDYSEDAVDGVEISYRDQTGKLWTSDLINPDPQTFEFLSLEQVSDDTGDFIVFEAVINCKLYNDSLTDFLTLENGEFNAYFKR